MSKMPKNDAILCHADMLRCPGVPLRELAAKYGVSDTTVRRIASGSHPHIAEKGPARAMERRQPIELTDCAMILGLFWMGRKISDIHKDSGIGLTTIHRILDGDHRYNDRPIR
ncbi:MAG: hypothetical protein CMP95_02770 [Gammaproteobacteria bacterium]|nr:hypothetical protein [Gammaproteobacteria bacterium]|tara:strand:+ start:26705 stop:27043 length:339 start_codon:yes stop_codon:yes gene_type:complete